MLELGASFITSFVITSVLLPFLIYFSHRQEIFDTPGGRKIHRLQTPSMGGIAIFLGLLLSLLIWIPVQYEYINYLYGAISLIAMLGLRDDVTQVKALEKLPIQLIAALIAVHFCQIRLHSFYGLLGIYEIPIFVSYFISVFTIIVITNAFNLIDGVDGLAASVCIIMLTVLGTWYYLIGNTTMNFIAFTLLGSVVAFTKFNWSPSEVFMGDTGSLLLGFLQAVLLITFIHANFSLPDYHTFKIQNGVAVACAIAIIPLFDTLRVFVLRLFKGKSPFHPDKSHIHHLLLNCGFSHAHTSLILASVNIFFIAFSLVCGGVEQNLIIIFMLLMAIALAHLLSITVLAKITKRKIAKQKSILGIKAGEKASS